jgi:hypothetical protein
MTLPLDPAKQKGAKVGEQDTTERPMKAKSIGNR